MKKSVIIAFMFSSLLLPSALMAHDVKSVVTSATTIGKIDHYNGTKVVLLNRNLDGSVKGDAPLIKTRPEFVTSLSLVGENGQKCKQVNWALLGAAERYKIWDRGTGIDLIPLSSGLVTNLNIGYDEGKIITVVLDSKGDEVDTIADVKVDCEEL